MGFVVSLIAPGQRRKVDEPRPSRAEAAHIEIEGGEPRVVVEVDLQPLHPALFA